MKKRTFLENALVQALVHGGWTVDIFNGKTLPESGFMTSYNNGVVVEVDKGGLLDTLVEFVDLNTDRLKEDGNFLGLWFEDGEIFFDVSKNIQDRGEALSFAVKNRQKAIYDCESGEVFIVSELTKLN